MEGEEKAPKILISYKKANSLSDKNISNLKPTVLDDNSASNIPESSLIENESVQVPEKATHREASTSKRRPSVSSKTTQIRMSVNAKTPADSITSDSLANSSQEQSFPVKRVPKRANKSKSAIAAAALARKRKQLAKIRDDPEKHAAFKAAERERGRKRRAERKIKTAKDMTSSELRIQRKRWRKYYHAHKSRQHQAKVGLEFGGIKSATDCDADKVHQPENIDGRKLRWKKEHSKNKKESERRIIQLQIEVEHYRKLAAHWKAKYYAYRASVVHSGANLFEKDKRTFSNPPGVAVDGYPIGIGWAGDELEEPSVNTFDTATEEPLMMEVSAIKIEPYLSNILPSGHTELVGALGKEIVKSESSDAFLITTDRVHIKTETPDEEYIL